MVIMTYCRGYWIWLSRAFVCAQRGRAKIVKTWAGNDMSDECLPQGADPEARMWSEVGADWISSARDRDWRQYSDEATGALVSRWLRPGNKNILKTDLFDEAVSGGLYPTLQKLSQTVHAIDVANDIVLCAQKKYPSLEARIADIRSLPFKAAKFDAVVSTSTLDHFNNHAAIMDSLREIRRVTAQGGYLLLTLDNPMNPKLALRAALPDTLLQKTGLVPYHCGATYAPNDLKAAIGQVGFEIVEFTAFLHCPRVLAVKAMNLAASLSATGLQKRLKLVLCQFERLERWPTRWRTGHYTALLARAI